SHMVQMYRMSGFGIPGGPGRHGPCIFVRKQAAPMANILIIDDEKAIRYALREILEHEGHKVDEAEDGATGLDKARKGRFDLVMCDIKMPRMDGLEVLEKLQAHDTDVPVVMISGHGTID